MATKRVLGVMIAAGLVLAACGDDDGADEGDTGGEAATETTVASETTGEDDVVVVEHQFGETEIEAVPERIVALNMQWADVLLAMGVEPVGVLGDTYAGGDGRYTWQEDVIEPDVMLDDTAGIPFEAVAALDPDLIVGTFVIQDEQQYELLSDIAPTIGLLDGRNQVDAWQDLAGVAGDFLRDDEAAADVVAEVDSMVAETREELPGLDGKTFALSQYVVGDAVYVVRDPDDGSSVFFQDLGMTLSPTVLELAGDEVRPALSPERIDTLDVDFLVFLVNGGDESNLADLPGWDQLPSVQNDAAAVLDYDTVAGLNTPSPLSIPHALEELRPALEAAAAG